MTFICKLYKRPFRLTLLFTMMVLFSACNGSEAPSLPEESDGRLSIPPLEARTREDDPLRVVATTSIIGDVVAQVGGDAIALTTLMSPGQDPHGFDPSAQLLTAVAQSDIIFINGWGLEEGLVEDLAEVGTGVPLIPISANIDPLMGGHDHEEEEDEEEHEEEETETESADPHVWQDVRHVMTWTDNVVEVLSTLDPANAELYEANGSAYKEALASLQMYAQTQLETIPQQDRVLVTNHDALAYLAEAHNLTILGTVIPGASTMAEPSANALAALVETMQAEGICAIFLETAVNDSLAQTVASELDHCDEVQLLTLHTDTLGTPGSGAESYLTLYRSNIDTLVEGLSQ